MDSKTSRDSVESATSSKLKRSKQEASTIETTESESHVTKEVDSQSDVIFHLKGPKSKKIPTRASPKNLLDNKILIEEIVSFLNVVGDSRLYSCKLIRSKIEQMDEIFWTKEAQKLAEVLRWDLEDMWSKRGSRTPLQVFLNLKNKVQKLEKKIRAMLDPKPKHRPVPLHEVSDIEDACSLAYHGILGPVRGLHLQHVDISSIPTEYLASLVACAKKQVTIWDVKMTDQVTFLDSVECYLLEITEQPLNTEETRALVRAMRTRVSKLRLELTIDYGDEDKLEVDLEELIKYDGTGKCDEVCFPDLFCKIEDFFLWKCKDYQYIEKKINTWVKSCDWHVSATKHHFVTVVQRRQEENDKEKQNSRLLIDKENVNSQ